MEGRIEGTFYKDLKREWRSGSIAVMTDSFKNLPFVVSTKVIFTLIERFSFECRKTKTKVITLSNHKEHRKYSEPIKTVITGS